MGWSFGWQSEAELVRDLTTPGGGLLADDIGVVDYRLTSSGIGSYGTLWVVYERRRGANARRFIMANWLDRNGDAWGFKSCPEAAHPFDYTCPVAFLTEVPEACAEWRAGVRAHRSGGSEESGPAAARLHGM